MAGGFCQVLACGQMAFYRVAFAKLWCFVLSITWEFAMLAKKIKALVFLSLFLLPNFVLGVDDKKQEVLQEVAKDGLKLEELETRGVLPNKNRKNSKNKVLASAFLGGGALALAALGYLFYPESNVQPEPGVEDSRYDKTFNVIFYGADPSSVDNVICCLPDAFVVHITCEGDSERGRRVHFIWGPNENDRITPRNAATGYFTADAMETIISHMPQTTTRILFVVDPGFATNNFYQDWGTGGSNICYVVSDWLTKFEGKMDFYIVHNVNNVHNLECWALFNTVSNFNGVFCLFNTSGDFKIVGNCDHQIELDSQLKMLINKGKHSTIRRVDEKKLRRPAIPLFNEKVARPAIRGIQRRASCHFDHFKGQYGSQGKYERDVVKFYEYGKIPGIQTRKENDFFYVLETADVNCLNQFMQEPLCLVEELQVITEE